MSKLDLVTVAATIIGLVVDLSTVYSWTGSNSSGSPENQGLLLTIFSFYSLTLISFYARRLLYRYKASQTRNRIKGSKPPLVYIPISGEQKRDIETAVLLITGLASTVFLLPPILSVDWKELQFSIYDYTFVDPPYLVLITFSCLLIVLTSLLISRVLYDSIVERHPTIGPD